MQDVLSQRCAGSLAAAYRRYRLRIDRHVQHEDRQVLNPQTQQEILIALLANAWSLLCLRSSTIRPTLTTSDLHLLVEELLQSLG
nr:hypothetical protein CFP56_77852 [Quercus suber]